MTAFRKVRDCGEGKRYTKAENMARNRSLLSKLKSMGYGVTSLKGVYPEGGNTEKRKSLFIFVSQDKGSLLTDVKRLGEEFDQNSVLLSGG